MEEKITLKKGQQIILKDKRQQGNGDTRKLGRITLIMGREIHLENGYVIQV